MLVCVIGNSVLYNPTGIYVTGSSQYNVFYRNNIIDNEVQVFPALGSHTLWNNGVEGNYWNCYEGIDLNGDGIGDTELPHLVDNRPLMEPWSRTRNYAIGSHKICVDCNCTIASFTFNQSQRQVSFLIVGPTGWNDSCEVTIPKELLAPNETALEMWIVMFGSSPLSDVTIIQNNFTRISLDYILGSSTSENRVRLKVSAFNLYPPTAGFAYTPSIASTIQPVNFTELSEESPNGTIIIRRWDFGDGNITTSNRKWLLHCYNRTGLFNVTFTVKDDNDLTDSITKSILVLNIAPVANFTFTPSEPCVGEEVTFDASSSIDPDGGIVGYFWSFGDGTTSENEAITTHTFKHVKSPESHYKVTLTVRDDDEANSSSAELVFVSKGLTMIQVDSPTTVKAEEYFILNVTLRDCASLPLSGKQIYIYDDDKYVSDENTGSEGAVRANISLSIAGEHVIRAEYKGSLDYSGSNDTTTVTVTPLNTTLTVVAPENVTQSEEFTIFAVLNSENETSVSNAPVEFYLHNGSSWESIGSSLTNQSGVASLSCTLQQVGAFILKAEFEGSGIYAASNSTEHSLTVVASEGGYFPHFAAVVVLVVIICVAFAALRIRRNLKRPRE
jgi:PKD repeat protein